MVKINNHNANTKLDIPQENIYKDHKVDKTQEWGESSKRGGNRGIPPNTAILKNKLMNVSVIEGE